MCQALDEKWRIARGSNSKDEDQNLKMPEELVRFFKSLALEALKSAHFVLFRRFNEEHQKKRTKQKPRTGHLPLSCPCHASRYMRPATDESTGQRELSMVWIIKAWSVEKMRRILPFNFKIFQASRAVTYMVVLSSSKFPIPNMTGVLARQREVQNDVAAITGIYENAESFWEHRVKNAHKRADTCPICIAVPQDPSVLRTAYAKCVFRSSMLLLKTFIDLLTLGTLEILRF